MAIFLSLVEIARSTRARTATCQPVEKRATAPSHDVVPGYLKTWGIPLIAGRDFDEHDLAEGRNVCLISQTGAKKVFPNENPIGKTLLVTSSSTPAEIVGIVGDVRSQRIAELPEMEFYQTVGSGKFSIPKRRSPQQV